MKPEHFVKAGVSGDIPLIIEGMENEEEFVKVVINGGVELDTGKMRYGVLNVCRKIINSGDVRSIVLECSNLPSFAYDIYNTFKLPVYDIVGLSRLVTNSVCPENYNII